MSSRVETTKRTGRYSRPTAEPSDVPACRSARSSAALRDPHRRGHTLEPARDLELAPLQLDGLDEELETGDALVVAHRGVLHCRSCSPPSSRSCWPCPGRD